MSRSSKSWFAASGRRSGHVEEEEESLKWAAIEKLPTHDRLRTSIFKASDDLVPRELVDVRQLNMDQRQKFMDDTFKDAEEDNEKFLRKLRNRINRVGIRLPTVEVRYDHLSIEADGFVGSRALPTLPNTARNIAESAIAMLGISLVKRKKLTILKDASGIIKPSRMTLLLGPPSSGKTTLLLALAGKLDSNLKVGGEVTYNGYRLDEFVPQKTSAYISQNDVHVGEMTVKETLDFSARCQGVGTRYDLLSELVRREKDSGIFPEAEVDLFMKATSIEGVESSLITDYVIKILGLDGCKDTIVGDEMHRGISGGQRKRVTTGEMIVGPTKTLFMDEISTGLDSSTTFQIVKCLQQIAHYLESTILVSLLQPAPETFDLFDDIILLSEGQIVYHGQRELVFEFFQSCGFKCPERKGTADFLQEVTSRKDQQQYWVDPNKPYRYVPVSEFVNKFNKFHVCMQLRKELSIPYAKSKGHRAALVFTRYSIPKLELLKACWDKEVLLMKRNSFFYVFKTSQIVIIGIVGVTVFLRTRLHTRNEEDAGVYVGALLFSIITNTFNGYPEIALNIARLPVFYKQRDLLFYPAWAFTIPNSLLKVPISIVESVAWLALTYYPIGFAPEASRFFKNFLLVTLISQMAGAMFKVIAGVCKVMVVSNTAGMFVLIFVVSMGGLILPRSDIQKWWKWGYWISPLSYAFNAMTVNELHAPRWMNKLASDGVSRLGEVVLKQLSVFNNKNWYWIGASAVFGFAILFNVLFTISLAYLDTPKKPQAIVADELEKETDGKQEFGKEQKLGRMRSKPSHPMSSFDANGSREMTIQRISSQSNPNRTSRNSDSTHSSNNRMPAIAKKGMSLPFTPLAMSFDEVNYYVDMPPEMKEQGVAQDKLQLLQGVTGAFRPGVLTALMGVSGAGKTTLMDVLAGRKTGGYVEGEIRISGFPKKQDTFARVSGYCEQTDIHSPQITTRESLIYSAFLRLPKEVSSEEKMFFVDQVMELVELEGLRDAIVGLPGVSGLSTEQRKRLTIAVELVSNPSIIFMDEPTSGLDARAAAIFMRTVRNTVDTGRTVVCTIHQPSIDIFEAFDELLLMKRGGQVIYFGPLGRHSYKLIKYFEGISGVPKIKEKYNPATWMLEVSSVAVETRLGANFAEIYKSSSLYLQNKALVKELSVPPQGAKDLHFTSQFSQPMWGQFTSCLWKQWKAYWRTPEYNLVRLSFTLIAALMLGSVFWKVGSKIRTSQDLTLIAGAMYISAMFLGVSNCQTVQPVVVIERTVFYRERAAGMYSALPYAFAQMACEIPYVLAQATYFSLIVFSMLDFHWTAAKFFWFYFVIFFTFLYFTFYGMMMVAITPNAQVAAILAASFYNFFNLFSGFFITRPKIPKWWVWYYWICPVGWTVTGLIVSQYGDDERTIKVAGIVPDPTIKWYLRHHFGYHSYFMGPTAGALVGFTVFFAFIFAFAIRKLNFQVR